MGPVGIQHIFHSRSPNLSFFFLNINLKKGDLAHLREEKELMPDIHTNMGKSQDNYVE